MRGDKNAIKLLSFLCRKKCLKENAGGDFDRNCRARSVKHCWQRHALQSQILLYPSIKDHLCLSIPPFFLLFSLYLFVFFSLCVFFFPLLKFLTLITCIYIISPFEIPTWDIPSIQCPQEIHRYVINQIQVIPPEKKKRAGALKGKPVMSCLVCTRTGTCVWVFRKWKIICWF